ncbi:hypothetical protein SLE2022_261140 [Rubroshorea leprosula]
MPASSSAAVAFNRSVVSVAYPQPTPAKNSSTPAKTLIFKTRLNSYLQEYPQQQSRRPLLVRTQPHLFLPKRF